MVADSKISSLGSDALHLRWIYGSILHPMDSGGSMVDRGQPVIPKQPLHLTGVYLDLDINKNLSLLLVLVLY